MADVPLPKSLKGIAPLVQRANELQQADRVIAYWCLYRAVQLAIPNSKSDPEAQQYLGHLLEKLEHIKEEQETAEILANEAQSKQLVEQFGMRVFVKADNNDRNGIHTKDTARLFLIASQFLSLMNCFGDLEADVAAKLKYAKYRCATITKMENETAQEEVVVPAPTLTDDSSDSKASTAEAVDLSDVDQIDMDMSKATTGNDFVDLTSALSVDTDALPKFQQEFRISHPRPKSDENKSLPVGSTTINEESFTIAQKHAKWAISALDYEDRATAIKELTLALQAMGSS